MKHSFLKTKYCFFLKKIVVTYQIKQLIEIVIFRGSTINCGWLKIFQKNYNLICAKLI